MREKPSNSIASARPETRDEELQSGGAGDVSQTRVGVMR
jgi:hypothetical protein